MKKQTSLIALTAFIFSSVYPYPLYAVVMEHNHGTSPTNTPTVSATDVRPTTSSIPSAGITPDQPLSSPTTTQTAAQETTHTHSTPHPDDPVLQAEHLAVFALVKDQDATLRVTQDSKWSDLDVKEGDRVIINEGVKVTVDDVFNETTIQWLRVDGTLEFDTKVNTGLRVDTLIVNSKGKFIMGTEDSPIDPMVEAKVIFQGKTDIDRVWDPMGFSRGLISHGEVSIHGAAKTSYVTLSEAAKGATSITLASIPSGWQAGDKLVLSGFKYNTHEELTIDRIEGSTLFLKEALKQDHKLPAGYGNEPPFSFHLANVSRNAVLESEAFGLLDDKGLYDPNRLGHVMFMHSDKVSVKFASSYNGRTDKLRPFVPSELENGALKEGTGENVGGRYAWHFHRTGVGKETPAKIEGSVAIGSQGWGFVNHSSNVNMDSNIAYNYIGAGFVEETGDGVGVMSNNLALHSVGSGFGLEELAKGTGVREQSFGHQGDGFWFQGGGVKAVNNVAVNQAGNGMIFFTQPLAQKGLPTVSFTELEKLDFLTHEDLFKIAGIDPNLSEDEKHALLEKAKIKVEDVPFFVDGLIAYGNKRGRALETWFHKLSAKHDVPSVIQNVSVWGDAFFNPYTNNVIYKNINLMGNTSSPAGTAMGINDKSKNFTYENLRVEGYTNGINIPVNGKNRVIGGYYNNVKSIIISSAQTRGRSVTIENVTFGSLTLKSGQQYDVWLQSNFNPKDGDISKLFENADVITAWGDSIKMISGEGEKQLYYMEQARDFVLSNPGLPDEIRGKTNAQLWDEFGMAMGATLPPADIIKADRMNAYIGSKAEYLPPMTIMSKKFTNQLTGYVLTMRNAADKTKADIKLPPMTLAENKWNFIRYTDHDGNLRTAMIYADTVAPTFVWDKFPTAIHPQDVLDVNAGLVKLTVKGMVKDQIGNLTSTESFKMDIKNIKVENGEVKISFQIKDKAGNTAIIERILKVDENAPRLTHLLPGYAKKSAPRVAIRLLLSLLGFKPLRDALNALTQPLVAMKV